MSDDSHPCSPQRMTPHTHAMSSVLVKTPGQDAYRGVHRSSQSGRDAGEASASGGRPVGGARRGSVYLSPRLRRPDHVHLVGL